VPLVASASVSAPTLSSTPVRRTYDHRVRELVSLSGDPNLLPDLDIPRSTAATWIQDGTREVVSCALVNRTETELRLQVLELQRRCSVLVAVISLVRLLLSLSGFRLQWERLRSGETKQRVLDAVDRATRFVPERVALKILGLSAARLHSWRRLAVSCSLDDRSSCPQTHPTQLTAAELRTMRSMATSEDYRHMPLRALALFAQRIGALFASATTWARTIRERGWRRPRKRVYPPKPKLGIRATAPGELLHIDVTIIRLLDATRAYLHGVIDNFSRKILAWRLAPRLLPQTTCEVLAEADSVLPPDAGVVGDAPVVMADGGCENFNGQVDSLLEDSRLERILARVDITFSNSMIEAWWRSLKYGWLFLNPLDTYSRLEKLIAFYVQQHNAVMPHSAHRGQTPDEVFAGVGDLVPELLAEQRRKARQRRIETNRALSCDSCFYSEEQPDAIPPPS